MRISHILLPIAAFALVSCGASSNSSSSSSSSAAMSAPSSLSANAVWDGTYLTGKHAVTLKTSKGDIALTLDADIAPKTVTNFIGLAKSGFYNTLKFHRVIEGFMIQGGDPNGDGTGGGSIYGPMFEDEINANSPLYTEGYKTGVIAMANRGPNTNGSQFFIMDADVPLPPQYTIFGAVTSGIDVVHAIARVPKNPSNDMPTTPVTFTVEVK